MWRASPLLAGALTAALSVTAAVCPAATLKQDDVRPRPGLYRVEVDSTSDRGKGMARTKTAVDGATGDTTTSTRLAGGPAHEQFSRGRAAQTQCIKALRKAAMPQITFSGGPPGCTAQTFKPTADGSVHTATCAGGSLRLTVRRLDNDVWEYVSVLDNTGAAVQPGLAWMRPTLEYQARHGTRPEDRAMAAKQLADLPRLEKEMASGRAEALEKMTIGASKADTPAAKAVLAKAISQFGTAPPLSVHERKVLTRISDTCE